MISELCAGVSGLWIVQECTADHVYSTLYEMMVSTNIYCSYELCTEITFLIPLANYHRWTLAVSNCLGYVARSQTSSIPSIHICLTAETVGFSSQNGVVQLNPRSCHNFSFTIQHSVPFPQVHVKMVTSRLWSFASHLSCKKHWFIFWSLFK